MTSPKDLTPAVNLSKIRLSELDLFRFAAVMMVVFFHYTFRGYSADNMTSLVYPYFSSWSKYGYLGVDLFFMISGFVILLTASKASPKKFVISRISRLYPAFWVCCTFTYLMILLMHDHRYSATFTQYLLNMTMLGGFMKVPSIDGAYWSLFIEIKFYFLVFVLLCFGAIQHLERIASAWLLLSLALLKWKAPLLSAVFFPEYAAYFIAGTLFYLIHAYGINTYRALIIVCCYILSLIQSARLSEIYARQFQTVYSSFAIGIVLAFFFIMFGLISTGRFRIRPSPVIIALGALTYPFYLIHQNIGFMIMNWAAQSFNSHIVILSTFLITMISAYLISQYIEKKYGPMLKACLSKYLRADDVDCVRKRLADRISRAGQGPS